MKIKLAPSLIAGDLGNINGEIKKIEDHCELIHVDVMDGNFVPNLTIGPEVIQHIKSKLPLDCHLMISNPDKHLEYYAKSGAAILSVHASTCKDPKATIKKIKGLGCKASLAINPDVSLDTIIPYLDDLDMVLIMSVYPGFSGQKFIPDVLPKVKELRKLKPDLDIEIDGGINPGNIKKVVEAGANIIVAGSAVLGKDDPVKAINDLRAAVK